MRTKDRLGRELRKIHLVDLALKAEQGYYDDYLSEITFPIMQLLQDLEAAGTADAKAFQQRVKDGEFDGTLEEGDEWLKANPSIAIFTGGR